MTAREPARTRADLHFWKMHGAGNDYVHVDGITGLRTDDPVDEALLEPYVQGLADRHFGVGGDGVILLAPSTDGRSACRMVMWNADGSRGAMCGNGIRCLALQARATGAVDSDSFDVQTDSGPRPVVLIRDDAGEITGARVTMGAVHVGDAVEGEVAGRRLQWFPGDAGNPHAVVFLDHSPGEFPVEAVGRAFQDLVPGGVNVEFVHQRPGTGVLEQRTFERGSGETLACGSGATVVGYAAWRTGRIDGNRAVVQLRGGRLEIEIEDGPESRITMTGPATLAFRGSIRLPVADRPPA